MLIDVFYLIKTIFEEYIIIPIFEDANVGVQISLLMCPSIKAPELPLFMKSVASQYILRGAPMPTDINHRHLPERGLPRSSLQ